MKKDKKINESLIGKIIYGFLMFAPLLAIMFTSLYATFNPNAKDSYSGTQTQIDVSYQYETNEVNSIDDLIVGNIYKLSLDGQTNISTRFVSSFIRGYRYEYLEISMLHINFDARNKLIISKTSSVYVVNVYTNNSQINNYSFITNSEFYFVYEGIENNHNDFFDYISKSDYLGDPIIEETEAPGTLDNAFYYALDKTEDSTLFNWSKNTGIYTVLYNACNGLGITTSFIPFILTYWLFISLIYLIYDLVLVFVHIAHKKVHELEEF